MALFHASAATRPNAAVASALILSTTSILNASVFFLSFCASIGIFGDLTIARSSTGRRKGLAALTAHRADALRGDRRLALQHELHVLDARQRGRLLARDEGITH